MEKHYHWLKVLNLMFKKIIDILYTKMMYILGLVLYYIVGLSATIGDTLLTKYDEIREIHSNRKRTK